MFKRIFSLLLVLVFMFSFCISALAASYDAATFSDMEVAFADDSGEDVNINVTNDIDCYNTLSAKEGVTYTIGSQNGSVLEEAIFGGSGTVNVNTDLTGLNALETYDSVTVNVTGDVTGDVTAEDSTGIRAYGESSVAVIGDVTGSYAGICAYGESSVTVTGDVTGGRFGILAHEESSVTVNGDVAGADGDPDAVDYSDPWDSSDGGNGVSANDSAVVTVNGDVSGGDSYGTFGFGGNGVSAHGESSVTVTGDVTGGSVTADPETEGEVNAGGYGVLMSASATVSVGGNASGGSTNGDAGVGGAGIYIETYNYEEDEGSATVTGSVTVAGSVTGGSATAENGTETGDIYVRGYEGCELPAVTVGSVDSIGGNLPEEELKAFAESVKVVGRTEPERKPVYTAPAVDYFWNNVEKDILSAEKGSELTIDAGNRTSMPVSVLKLAAEREITLIIRWNGGEDIVVKGEVDVSGDTVTLKELAELVK